MYLRINILEYRKKYKVKVANYFEYKSIENSIKNIVNSHIIEETFKSICSKYIWAMDTGGKFG